MLAAIILLIGLRVIFSWSCLGVDAAVSLTIACDSSVLGLDSMNAVTSFRVILPFIPVPSTCSRSILFSSASLKTAGEYLLFGRSFLDGSG